MSFIKKNFKLFLMLFLFFGSTFAFAQTGGPSDTDYVFTVENTTMVDAYFNVFNAIAAIFSSGTYYDILRLAFLLGGFFVFVGGILSTINAGGSSAQGTLIGYSKYYIASTALIIVIFSKTSTMWVVTNEIPTFCAEASPSTGQAVEIPSVLGFSFATMNLMGKELTDLAETAFSLPSSTGTTSMADQDGFAGSIKNAIKIMDLDPNDVTLSNHDGSPLNFRTAWSNFFADCVYEVANNKGVEGAERVAELQSSENLYDWVTSYLNTPFTGTTRLPGESFIEIGGQHMTCQDFYDEVLVGSKDAFVASAACALPTVNSGALQIITGTSDLGATEFGSIALQSGLISALAASESVSGVGVQSGFVTGKTIGESNLSNIENAGYMAKMLPYMQMTMRAILYAFFPFVFIVVILPGGLGVLKSYGQTMAWIELWGPTAAVVNMFVNLHAENKISHMYTESGLTSQSVISMISEADTISGVAGMLYLSVPALTWLILKGSGHMLGNIAGGVSAQFARNITADSVNKDVQDLKTQTKVSEKLGKVVSLGEAQHYEATQQGINRGSTIAALAQMGEKAYSDSVEAQTKQPIRNIEEQLKSTDGNVDSLVNINATEQRKKFETTKKVLDQTGIMTTDGEFSEEAFQDLTSSDAGKATIESLKNNDVIKAVMEEENTDFKGAIKHIIKNKSTAEIRDYIETSTKHETTGEIDKYGNRNLNKIKEIGQAKGADQAKGDLEVVETLKKLDIYDPETGEVDNNKLNSFVDSNSTVKSLEQSTNKENLSNLRKYYKVNSNKELLEEMTTTAAISKTMTEMETDKIQKFTGAKKDRKIDQKRAEEIAEGNAGTEGTKDIANVVRLKENKNNLNANDPTEVVNTMGEARGKGDAANDLKLKITYDKLKTKEQSLADATNDVAKTKTDLKTQEKLNLNDGEEINDKAVEEVSGVNSSKDALNYETDKIYLEKQNIQNGDTYNENEMKRVAKTDAQEEENENRGEELFQKALSEEEIQRGIAGKKAERIGETNSSAFTNIQAMQKDEQIVENDVNEVLKRDNSAEIALLFNNLAKRGITNEDLTKKHLEKTFEDIDTMKANETKNIKGFIENANKENEKVIKMATDKGIKREDVANGQLTFEQLKNKGYSDDQAGLAAGISATVAARNNSLEGLKDHLKNGPTAEELKQAKIGEMVSLKAIRQYKDGSYHTTDTYKDFNNASEADKVAMSKAYQGSAKGREITTILADGNKWNIAVDNFNKRRTDLISATQGYSMTGKYNYDAMFAAGNVTQGKYADYMAIGSSAIGHAGTIAGSFGISKVGKTAVNFIKGLKSTPRTHSSPYNLGVKPTAQTKQSPANNTFSAESLKGRGGPKEKPTYPNLAVKSKQ